MELRFPNEGSIPEFLTALASHEDPHGVVAAAAVAGAMGVSLLQMVATLPQTLPRGDDDQAAHVSAVEALVHVQEELLETVETETAVKLAVALLEAAFNGARSNLEAKLSSLTDAVRVASIAEQIASFTHDAAAAADKARSFVKLPPA